MDLTEAIRELHAHKVRLEKIMGFLELLREGHAQRPAPRAGKRRGRKSMSPEARAEVSERMKKYWAKRHQQNNFAQPGA